MIYDCFSIENVREEHKMNWILMSEENASLKEIGEFKIKSKKKDYVSTESSVIFSLNYKVQGWIYRGRKMLIDSLYFVL